MKTYEELQELYICNVRAYKLESLQTYENDFKSNCEYMKHTLNHMEHVRDCMEACFANHCHMCRAGAAVGGGVD